MAKRLWLLFAQATTLGLAALFVVSTLKPSWLDADGLLETGQSVRRLGANGTVTISETPPPASSLREAAAAAMPAVVYIHTRREEQPHPLLDDPVLRRFFGERLPESEDSPSGQGLGSGVIVTPEGHVLTNHHVVEEASQVVVTLSDGRQAEATIVGSDPESDLAVLKISLDQLPVIRFGQPRAMQPGDTVLAIGNPFGVGLTVTQGIISAVGRSEPDLAIFGDFLQTDAAINPGNSGGALVDANGSLVGINTAIISRGGGSLGIGFAIASDSAQRVLESILANGRVRRGFLGVEPQDVDDDIASSLGLSAASGSILARISPGGPADRAGLQVGDVVVGIDTAEVRNREELLARVAELEPGSTVQLKIIRSGRETTVPVTLAERPTLATVPSIGR